ncbi:MAG TPA: glycosyltransferase family 2 protein [Bryobacteraceae bacterium]|jgi:cellulose synthase/poly-beta-1,6-N-acetylglucosamine synthase-like glycosyltransferase|nr:glycosyltransferase family 2 protein [Bryobacteraceae bacterium]
MSVMGSTALVVFWLCAFLIVYTYLLYPGILFCAYCVAQIRSDLRFLAQRGNRRSRNLDRRALPGVSVIVPAHNEEKDLPAKIANLDEIDYPAEKLQFIFVSDGSEDRTAEILGEINDPRVEVHILSQRGGKASALNYAVERARHEILVFSDSTTLLTSNAIATLARHYVDPTVGAVCGSLQFQGNAVSQQTEGVYWKYESMIRLMEARLGATMTASGALFALRKECFEPLSQRTIIDDFVLPMRARKRGFRVLYDPEAIAIEFAASSVAGEFTRRVRLAMGSFRALPEFLRIRLRGFSLVAFLSHKLLRWVLPFLLIGVLCSNLFLLESAFFRYTLAMQGVFYFWALLGALMHDRLRKIPYALIAYFLLAMNMAFLVGFARCFSNRKEAAWQTVR